MSKGFFIRSVICILFLAFCLYSYLDMQNEITELRIRIPHLTNEVRRIEEENAQFQFQIEAFESPENLMKIAQKHELAHLKFPLGTEVMTLVRADPLKNSSEKKSTVYRKRPKITFAKGVHP